MVSPVTPELSGAKGVGLKNELRLTDRLVCLQLFDRAEAQKCHAYESQDDNVHEDASPEIAAKIASAM